MNRLWKGILFCYLFSLPRDDDRTKTLAGGDPCGRPHYCTLLIKKALWKNEKTDKSEPQVPPPPLQAAFHCYSCSDHTPRNRTRTHLDSEARLGFCRRATGLAGHRSRPEHPVQQAEQEAGAPVKQQDVPSPGQPEDARHACSDVGARGVCVCMIYVIYPLLQAFCQHLSW